MMPLVPPAPQSSGSEEDGRVVIMDEKKRKRMLSNRESARRSRMRKQQHLDDLLNQVARLKDENSQILMHSNVFAEQYASLESENAVLRTQVMELTDRLRSLNSVLRLVEEVSGMAMEVPEPLLEPWQLPRPAWPIMASANVFRS